MLYDNRRKRGRQAMAVAPPPTTTTTARSTAAVNTARLAAPIVRAHAATGRFLETLPRHSRQQQHQMWMMTSGLERATPAGPVVSLRSPTAATTTTMTVTAIEPAVRRQTTYAYASEAEQVVESELADVHKMIRHAHRARRLLLDRLTVVNLRRNHRCELLEEVARLKKVLASLQEQVDATTRNVAKMDRLVQHLQTISSIFTDAIQAPITAPAAAVPLALTVGCPVNEEDEKQGSSPSLRAAASAAVMASDVQVTRNEVEAKAKQLQQVEAVNAMSTPVDDPLESKDDVADGVEATKAEEDAEEEQDGEEAAAAE